MKQIAPERGPARGLFDESAAAERKGRRAARLVLTSGRSIGQIQREPALRRYSFDQSNAIGRTGRPDHPGDDYVLRPLHGASTRRATVAA